MNIVYEPEIGVNCCLFLACTLECWVSAAAERLTSFGRASAVKGEGFGKLLNVSIGLGVC
jgi:hypothetical protein